MGVMYLNDQEVFGSPILGNSSINHIADGTVTGALNEHEADIKRIDSTLEKVDDAIEDINPSLPDYWKTYLDSRLAKCREYIEADMNSDSFIFFTDYHYETSEKHTGAIVKYLSDKLGTSFVVCGGDIYKSSKTSTYYDVSKKAMESLTKPLGNIPLFTVLGNHDYNNNSHELSDARAHRLLNGRNTLIANFDGGTVNFYVDNVGAKIRYLFVSDNKFKQVKRFDSSIWLAEQLLKVPKDYNVVIFFHLSIGTDGKDLNGYLNLDNLTDRIDFDYNLTIAKSFNNRVVRKVSDGTNLHSYDFSKVSGNGKVILVLSGHVHKDVSSYISGLTIPSGEDATSQKVKPSYGTSGIPAVASVCDSFDVSSASKDNNGRVRTKGTETEHAIDVVTINKTTKEVTLVRIGDGHTNRVNNDPLDAEGVRTFSFNLA